jgi:hypothetical protein
MSSSSEFTLVQVPARIADLEFTYLRPAHFQAVELTDETADFVEPTKFFPLHVVRASYGAVRFSVGARPAYGHGSVQDWAEFLSKESNVEIISAHPGALSGLPAYVVEVLQPSDSGPLRMRTAFLEDGERLLNVSIMAPDAIWASVEATLRVTFASFRLAEPRGTITPLTRAEIETSPANSATAAAGAKAGALRVSGHENPTPSAELAPADTGASLDSEHPTNVRMRDNADGGIFLRLLVES